MSELPTGHNLTLNINGGCAQCDALRKELVDTIEEVDSMRIGCNALKAEVERLEKDKAIDFKTMELFKADRDRWRTLVEVLVAALMRIKLADSNPIRVAEEAIPYYDAAIGCDCNVKPPMPGHTHGTAQKEPK